MAGPEPGQPVIRSGALIAAASALASALAVSGVTLSGTVILATTRRTIRAFLLEDRKERLRDKRISPLTLSLSEMEVGDRKLFPPHAPQTYKGRFRSARKLMSNTLATWVCDTIQGEMWICRLPDGARPTKRPENNLKAVAIAKIFPSDGYVLCPEFLHRRQLGTNTKVTARKILLAPEADWSAFTRREGVYVRRTK